MSSQGSRAAEPPGENYSKIARPSTSRLTKAKSFHGDASTSYVVRKPSKIPSRPSIARGRAYQPSPAAKLLGIGQPRVEQGRSGSSPLSQPAQFPPKSRDSSISVRSIDRDKPLSSPPALQIINSNSPLRVSRTLIDASILTPSEKEFPVLQPENSTPHIMQSDYIDTDVLQSENDRSNITVSVTIEAVTTDPDQEPGFSPPTSIKKEKEEDEEHLLVHALSGQADDVDDSPLAQKDSKRRRQGFYSPRPSITPPPQVFTTRQYSPSIYATENLGLETDGGNKVEQVYTQELGQGKQRITVKNEPEVDAVPTATRIKSLKPAATRFARFSGPYPRFHFPAGPLPSSKQKIGTGNATRNFSRPTAAGARRCFTSPASTSAGNDKPQIGSGRGSRASKFSEDFTLSPQRPLLSREEGEPTVIANGNKDRKGDLDGLEAGLRSKRLSSHDLTLANGLGGTLTIDKDADTVLLHPTPRKKAPGKMDIKEASPVLGPKRRSTRLPLPSPRTLSTDDLLKVPYGASSKMGTGSTGTLRGENAHPNTAVKIKRSIRNLWTPFSKHGNKGTDREKEKEKRSLGNPAERSAGTAHATRARKTLSEQNERNIKSPRRFSLRGSKKASQGVTAAIGDVAPRQASFNTSSTPFSPTSPSNPTTTLTTLLSHINTFPQNSPDRQKSLELAQALLTCINSAMEAKIAATKAEESARNAELHANTVQISLQRLVNLAQPGLDGKVLADVKQLVRDAELGVPELYIE